jgi:hypothetical protein
MADTTVTTTQSPPRERVDDAVYEGWNFDEVNEQARELRAVAREQGHDAAASACSGTATVVVRHSA